MGTFFYHCYLSPSKESVLNNGVGKRVAVIGRHDATSGTEKSKHKKN
jgi:hypothetical protein